MYVIGITGGVGSGKSLVAKLAGEKYNAELLIADKLGHAVIEPGTPGFDKVTERFGSRIIENGTINRDKLSSLVFNDDKALMDLNAIIHPEVIAYIKKYIDDRKDKEGYIFVETAVMYETGCDKLCDEVWYVYVPADIRIKRLSGSRGYSREKSLSIIEKQKPDKFFTDRADRVIDNSGSRKKLDNILNSL